MFVETPRFPDRFLVGSSFGPEFNTSIVQSGVGEINEFRISNRTDARRIFSVSVANDDDDDIQEILNWFWAMVGRFNGFRVKDPSDHRSCPIFTTPTALDQVIGVGETTAAFQLIKEYKIGAYRNRYTVKKPVADTTLVAVDGVTLGSGGFTVDTTTGIVTLGDSSVVITGVTLGSPTIITFTGDALLAGQTLLLDSIVGTTELNGNRYVVETGGAGSASLTVDSTAFTAYTSGGTGDTLPAASATLTVTGVTRGATTLIATSGAHGRTAGDTVRLAGIVGTTELNDDWYEVLSSVNSTTFEISVDSSLMAAYVSDGTASVGGLVTAGFDYDVPVRFDTDSLEALTFDSQVTAGITALPIIEITNV